MILDEGHCIKNARANQAKAAHKIKAERRWSVTGTPIQNSCATLPMPPKHVPQNMEGYNPLCKIWSPLRFAGCRRLGAVRLKYRVVDKTYTLTNISDKPA